MRLLAAAALLVTLLLPRGATAQNPYPLITDRDFTLDGHMGAVVASYRIVGMGGTAIATAEGAPHMALNPASPAVRRATSNDWFDWDWTLDSLQPNLGEDIDGNGLPQESSLSATSATFGAVLMFGRWGFGVYGATDTRLVTLEGGGEGQLLVSVAHLTLARSFADSEWTVGGGLVIGNLVLSALDAAGGEGTVAVDVAPASFEAGAMWRPPGLDLRVGAVARLPLSASVETAGCDPLDCAGYILPERFAIPWTAGVGAAWRFGPTGWNQQVAGDWRDEKSLIVAADIWLIGGTARGAGLESFADHRLQPSGRDPVDVSVRAGLEYEWIPGRLRLRTGSYWEPSRFEGVPGRVHGTVGLDVRLWSFCFWGDRFRLRFSLASDAARGYANAIASLGFWH